MFRYAHTNMIARDHKKLIAFYKAVFHCRSIGETRDLRGEWLDRLTGLSGAHIVGEHLCLPDTGRIIRRWKYFPMIIWRRRTRKSTAAGWLIWPLRWTMWRRR